MYGIWTWMYVWYLDVDTSLFSSVAVIGLDARNPLDALFRCAQYF